MGTNGRNTHGCATDWKIISKATNLTCFPCDFHFFFGVSIFLEFVDLWNDIERQRVCKDVILDFFAIQKRFGSLCEFIHSRLTSSTCSLICAHQNLFQIEEFVQRPNGHESNGSGTVGVGNEFRLFGFLSIDFGNYQRNVFFISESRLQKMTTDSKQVS